MRTVNEVMTQECGIKFDRIRQPNGLIFYYQWQPMSIEVNGIVFDLGKHYFNNVMIVSEDDMEVLDFDVIPNYDDNYYFIKDTAAWAKAVDMSSAEGLIGLPRGEFNSEVSRRYKEEHE